MQAVEARPPYVVFETKAIEDRQATIEAGYYKTKDVDFAIVTPQGSKDRIERNVKDWFEQVSQQVTENRFPQEWLTAYRSSYQAWKEGRELPVSGTSVMHWPVASPAQVKSLLDAKVRTVEDLAQANEETIGRLGMGGRALKEKAVNWLAVAGSSGKMTEELAALQVKLREAEARNATLETQLRDLITEVKALTNAKK